MLAPWLISILISTAAIAQEGATEEAPEPAPEAEAPEAEAEAPEAPEAEAEAPEAPEAEAPEAPEAPEAEAPEAEAEAPGAEAEDAAPPAEGEPPATIDVSGMSADALPADPVTFSGTIDVVGPKRGPHDHVIFVRVDGQLYLDDTLMDADDIRASLPTILAEDPEARVIVESDAEADALRLRQALQMAYDAGCTRLAIDLSDVDVGSARDSLFAAGIQTLDTENIEEMGDGLSKKELRKLQPKRWKFPQNPYGSVDFTSYTLEWGEARVGLFNVYYGIAPRTQIGTVPLADLIGVYNANIKVNPFRGEKLDYALKGSFYYVPVNDLVNQVDSYFDLGLASEANDLFTTDIMFFTLGAMASAQIAKPWSVHAGASYAQVQATGALDMAQLPDVLIPVDSEEAMAVSSISGEMLNVEVATDLRFNRRDSIVVRAQAPLFGRARGAVSTDIEELGIINELDVLVAYGDMIPLSDAYRVSLSYQAQWKHIEARVGIGTSPIQGSWLVQAFDLSYRFGGKTRRGEYKIRKGYRQNKRALRKGKESEGAELPPEQPAEGKVEETTEEKVEETTEEKGEETTEEKGEE